MTNASTARQTGARRDRSCGPDSKVDRPGEFSTESRCSSYTEKHMPWSAIWRRLAGALFLLGFLAQSLAPGAIPSLSPCGKCAARCCCRLPEFQKDGRARRTVLKCPGPRQGSDVTPPVTSKALLPWVNSTKPTVPAQRRFPLALQGFTGFTLAPEAPPPRSGAYVFHPA